MKIDGMLLMSTVQINNPATNNPFLGISTLRKIQSASYIMKF